MKRLLAEVPGLRRIAHAMRTARFPGTVEYWEQRYADGGNSGAGSYGMWADYKADVLNTFVAERSIRSVVEWGCGDGNQLSLANYPQYIGLDVSRTAVERCAGRFAGDATKNFHFVPAVSEDVSQFRGDLAISLEVIFHLIEDDVRDAYLRRLFESADRFVVVYATDSKFETVGGAHENRRPFTPWVEANAPDWKLTERIVRPERTDPIESDFFVYTRRS